MENLISIVMTVWATSKLLSGFGVFVVSRMVGKVSADQNPIGRGFSYVLYSTSLANTSMGFIIVASLVSHGTLGSWAFFLFASLDALQTLSVGYLIMLLFGGVGGES